MATLGFDNRVFAQYVCYSTLLVLQSFAIALLVIRSRVKRKVCVVLLQSYCINHQPS